MDKLWRVRNQSYPLDDPQCGGWLIVTYEDTVIYMDDAPHLSGKYGVYWNNKYRGMLMRDVLDKLNGTIVTRDEE